MAHWEYGISRVRVEGEEGSYTGLIAVTMDLTRIWPGPGLGFSRLETISYEPPTLERITPFMVSDILGLELEWP